MSRYFFGFYELDASPQRGLPGELATRLGNATETPGFIDDNLYTRSDNFGVAIQVQFGEEDGWEERGAVSLLLQAADWRSRVSELDTYRLARRVEGDGEALKDSTFFIVQRFAVDSNSQSAFVAAICEYTEAFAAPIPGFLGGEAFASLDGKGVVFVMPWAHEAALGSLENRPGSLAAMQKHLRMSTRHVFSSYQRVSYLRGAAPEPAASASRSENS